MFDFLSSNELTFALIGGFICWLLLLRARTLKGLTILVCAFLADWIFLLFYKILHDGVHLVFANSTLFIAMITYLWRTHK